MSDGRKKTEDRVVTQTPPTSPPPPPQPLPFDKVEVDEGGARKDLTPAEFFALPLALRIQYVVQQKAAFFADGQRVDSRAVLGQIRKLRAHLH